MDGEYLHKTNLKMYTYTVFLRLQAAPIQAEHNYC